MELFDTILNELGGSPSDALDGGGSLGDDAGNSSWGDALSGLFGGDDAAGGDGGGWSGALSGLVDRLSGDGDRDSVFSGLADRVSEFVPAGIRDAAGSLFSAEGGASGAVSSWVGSLLEPAAGETAASGGSVAASASAGHELHDDVDPYGAATSGFAADYDEPGADPDAGAAAYGDDPDGPHELDQLEDPTFPDDDAARFAPADEPDMVAEPLDNFEQAIEDADAIDESFDAMLEGLE